MGVGSSFKKKVTVLFFVGFAILSSQFVFAGFSDVEFRFLRDELTAPAIDLSKINPDDKTFTRTFRIGLIAKGPGKSNKGASYRIAFSEVRSTIKENGETTSRMPSHFFVTTIDNYISAARVSRAPMNLGDWTDTDALHTTNASPVQLNIDLTFDKQKVYELAQQEKALQFYVVGESTSDLFYSDELLVTVPFINPAQVKISGLSDIAFPEHLLSEDDWFEQDESFCVYSSSSSHNYKIRFEGLNVPMGGQSGHNFVLLRDDATLSKFSAIPYTVDFKEEDDGGWDEITTISWLETTFQGSPFENCGHKMNASLRIRVAKSDLNGKDPGIYRDTLKITVAPI